MFLLQADDKLRNAPNNLETILVIISKEPTTTPQYVKLIVSVVCETSSNQPDFFFVIFFLNVFLFDSRTLNFVQNRFL